MHPSRFITIFAFLTFLSIVHSTLTTEIPTLNMTTGLLISRSAELEERLQQYTLRNMHFCTYSFDRNTCVLGSHFVDATGEAELLLFNYDCLLIGRVEASPATRVGNVVNCDSRLPNTITYTVSEWWPTFEYEGAHYANPTCVEDSRRGASGCWQTFTCEEREVIWR